MGGINGYVSTTYGYKTGNSLNVGVNIYLFKDSWGRYLQT